MPCFKNPKTGKVVEVSEDHANQVLRPQKVYGEHQCQNSDAKKTESKAGSGVTKGSATSVETQKKKPKSKAAPSKRRSNAGQNSTAGRNKPMQSDSEDS